MGLPALPVGLQLLDWAPEFSRPCAAPAAAPCWPSLGPCRSTASKLSPAQSAARSAVSLLANQICTALCTSDLHRTCKAAPSLLLPQLSLRHTRWPWRMCRLLKPGLPCCTACQRSCCLGDWTGFPSFRFRAHRSANAHPAALALGIWRQGRSRRWPAFRHRRQ